MDTSDIVRKNIVEAWELASCSPYVSYNGTFASDFLIDRSVYP